MTAPLDAARPPGKRTKAGSVLALSTRLSLCIQRFRWVDLDLTVGKRKKPKPNPLYSLLHLVLQPQTQHDFGMTLIDS